MTTLSQEERQRLRQWSVGTEAAYAIHDLLAALEAVEEREKKTWDIAHELMVCGHPRACWQDRNYPASEENYNSETRTSDPPMDYRCVACEKLQAVKDERDEKVERLAVSFERELILQAERDALAESCRTANLSLEAIAVERNSLREALRPFLRWTENILEPDVAEILGLNDNRDAKKRIEEMRDCARAALAQGKD